MARLLKVSNWSKHFENNRTRELKHMDWVPIPVKMDGDGYTELVSHSAGASHLGAWLAIVEVAARCDPRGTLLRAGEKPHDSGSLSRISRIPASVFDEAIPRLLEIGWLESEVVETQDVTPIPHEGATLAMHDPAPACDLVTMERKGTEGKGIEGNGKTHRRSAVADGGFESFWSVVPRKVGRREAETAFEKAAARIAGRVGPGGENPDAFLVERMTVFAKSAQGRSGQFCPHPSTWLNQGRYDDDPAEWNRRDDKRDPRGTLGAAREFLEMADG